jgi:hypothetical protein
MKSPPTLPTPLPNTYWVLPGRLLAGEHPRGADERETRERFDRLRDAGIDYFIDLTEEHESEDYRLLLPAQTLYMRCGIPDMCVPDDPAQIRRLQMCIRGALSIDRHLYVHCRAGIGRTGLVIGCYLAEESLDGEAALKELNRLWRQSARAKSWPRVPQTPEQGRYIELWPQHRISALSPRVHT